MTAPTTASRTMATTVPPTPGTSVPGTPSAPAAPSARGGWTDVCPRDRLEPERGVAALVDGVQVAVFRLHDGSLHAVDHHDPCSGANVIARGIVGTRGDRPIVVSPMYKQAFDLVTGDCLDDPGQVLGVHRVRVRDGLVQVALGPDPIGSDGIGSDGIGSWGPGAGGGAA